MTTSSDTASAGARHPKLITAALPYANSHLHIGHVFEHLMVDMWGRFQKMRGYDCAKICASDAHGTPIMISARKEGIEPEDIAAKYRASMMEDLGGFHINYDSFSSTHTETNRQMVEEFFAKMQEAGTLTEKETEQAYCEHDKMFLPDRFVKGQCPRCKAFDQYGDNCEVCNATYDPMEMLAPKCTICGNTPVARKTRHQYFTINQFKSYLQGWISNHTQKDVANKLMEWFKEDLRDWCITRDAPYFGFKVPGFADKYFYVWVDAPLGYISSTKEYCDREGKDYSHYWQNPDCDIYHVIGKDIVYFHTLFWPAVLKTAGYTTPKSVVVHGMITLGGEKMSKSRGISIQPKVYLKHLDAEYLRYYLGAKVARSAQDINFDFDDFQSRVNSDLVGKITNVASRGASMLGKLDGVLGEMDDEGLELLKQAKAKFDAAEQHFDEFNFAKGLIEVREIADIANRYFDAKEPWKLLKSDPEATKVILTNTINIFRLMAIALTPVLPEYSRRAATLLGEARQDSPEAYCWQDAERRLENHPIAKYNHLISRMDPKKFAAFVKDCQPEPESGKDEGTKDQGQGKKGKKAKAAAKESAEPTTATMDDFSKIDLRVARIESAELVEGANRLLKLVLDLGDRKIQVFSGIRKSYLPKDLEGRLTVCIANLQPRKMKFGLSEGMVLACGQGDDVYLLSPDAGAKPGQRIT